VGSATTTINVSYQDQEGSGVIALTPTVLTNTVHQRFLLSLVSGANTVTIPTGTTIVALIPPPANTQTLTLKGVSGDTGINMSRTQPTIVYLDTLTPSSSLVVTAGGAVTGFIVDMF
jgi:hypothetical protein